MDVAIPEMSSCECGSDRVELRCVCGKWFVECRNCDLMGVGKSGPCEAVENWNAGVAAQRQKEGE
jgi:hypothetical protein